MELLCLSSRLLFLLRDSTSKSLLQFFIQHYTRSGALILEKATETKEELKDQKSLRDEPGHAEKGPPHGTSGQAAEACSLNQPTFSHPCAPFPALVAPGVNTALPVHLTSCVLQHTFEGHFLLTVPDDDFIHLYNNLSLCRSNCGKWSYTVPTNKTCYLSQHSPELNRLHLWCMKNVFLFCSKFTPL